MADSSPSPCKVSLNGAFRRFLLPRPALWRDFEDKIRVVYSLPPNALLDVQYKDEEGDVIKLNTDGELDDVLAMHALFSHIAPVKFEVSVSFQESLPSSTASSSRSNSIMGDPLPQLTSCWLSGLNQNYSGVGQVDLSSTIASDTVASPLSRPRYQPSSSYGSDQSDDVSLIELEDSQELHLGSGHHETHSVDNGSMDERISYPQHDIDEALRVQKEMEQLEAYKLDAPVFTSSVLCNTRTTVEDYSDDQSDADSMEQNQYDQAEDDQEPDTPLAGAVAAAVEHYETLASRSQKCVIDETTPLLGFETMHINNDADVLESSSSIAVEQPEQAIQEQAEPILEQVEPVALAEPSAPSMATASTSTSDRGATADDNALIEQFQMLVKEFQDIIQNNPQLVALAGSIMTKILSNVKVNVESFAGYLQTQAQIAAQNAHQAGQQVAAQAQEAASHIQEKAQEVASKVQERATQAPGPPSFPPGETSSFPASGGHSIFGQHQRRQHQYPSCNRPFFAHHQGHPSPFFLHHARRNHFYERSHQHNLNQLHHHHLRHTQGDVNSEAPSVGIASLLHPMTMGDMPPMPSVPLAFSLPEADPSLGLRRGHTVQSSRSPRLFSPRHRSSASASDLDRPVVYDIESPFTEEGMNAISDDKHKDEKGKAVVKESTLLVDVSGDQSHQSSSSSHMPGSFPRQPEMSNVKVGWSWTRLPDEGAEHHQPPSTRAKFGWVWNDNGGEKAEIAEDEGPTPLYTHLTENPAQATLTPGSFPFSHDAQRNGSRELFRSSSLHIGHGDNTQDDGAGEHLKLKRHQTIHSVHRDAQISESNADTANTSANGHERRRQELAQQKQSILEQRKVIEEQRQKLDDMRREQAAQRVEQMVSRARPVSHIGSFPSTPGDFPTVPIVRAPSVRTRVRAAPPARPAAMVPPSPAVPAPPVPAPVPAAAMPATTGMNPFADPFEFENELRTIVDMGFEDTAELRTVMQDFGGEVEAIVEFLIAQ
ncbi:hypothetical protein BGZ70_001894 [Mortierella alpina]|uniref:PB1 domain-containing protein n=1 Tax=Mortierella alpina TaxID=64518 RepID=A0A9P6M5I3_MORAP|nr:hypothetical protein BGZ70_001894 [Mortierella alpina]